MLELSLWWLLFSKAAVYGLMALVGTLVALRQSARFRRRGYWWCLAGAVCMAFTMPLGYMWMQSNNISFTDALLLRQVRAGSWLVAEGYAILAGTAIAGLVNLM